VGPEMSDAPNTTYSTDGMICPYCATLWHPDSSDDHDESGFDMTCDNCKGTFSVQPEVSWSWSCGPVKAPPLQEPDA
jgi:hypothetical protein